MCTLKMNYENCIITNNELNCPALKNYWLAYAEIKKKQKKQIEEQAQGDKNY